MNFADDKNFAAVDWGTSEVLLGH